MRLISLVFAFLVLGLTPALANGTNWYVEGTASYQKGGDLDHSNSQIDYDNGFLVGFAIGGLLANSISAEAELTYGDRDAEHYSYALQTWALMANAYYNFQVANAVAGYFGGGLGMVNVEGDFSSSTYDDTVFGYQAMIGFTYAVNTAMLFAEYRYQAANDADFNGNDQEYNSHSVGVGVRIPIN